MLTMLTMLTSMCRMINNCSVLIIKFLLRLKLELHTIGVLKCFGYSRKVIFTTYNIGNAITIFIGSIIALIPIGFCFAKYYIGYDYSTIINFYFSEQIFYNIMFLILIIIASIITTTFFLYRYTEKENIYELIKYEG